jgi:hypothetical protein
MILSSPDMIRIRMFDLDFYNQVFQCINFSSRNTYLGLSSSILSTRGSIRQRPDVLNDYENNRAVFKQYKDNGINDYVNDYIDYFN